MGRIILGVVDFVAKIHSKILTLNNNFGWGISDKWLHFLVIGIFGFCMLLVIQPLFKWLEKRNGTIIISFIYVFSAVLVVTLAIEIGQAYTGTGDMDKYDVASGVAGFFVFFALYLVFYFKYLSKIEENKENHEDNEKTAKK